MKRFLKNVALFSCVVLVICAIIEIGLLNVSNEYTFKRNYIEHNGNSITVLSLGHSHIGNGFNAKLIGDSVFNIATQGRRTYYDSEIVKRYVPHLKNLEYVVFPLGYDFQYNSYKNIVKERQNNLASYYRCMFAKYWDMPYPGDFKYEYWSEIIYSPTNFINRFFIKDFQKLNECDTKGWESADITKRNPDWETEHIPIIFNRDSEEAKAAFDENIEYLKIIAQVCKNSGVRLIVVTMPCYKTYTELMTPRGIKEMMYCVEEMKKVYPEMEYHNFINDQRFREEDFFNSSHLSNIGATKFAKIFKDEIL